MARSDDNRYRLEAYAQFAGANEATQHVIAADLAHQRRIDWVLAISEVLAILLGTGVAITVLVLAFVLAKNGHPGWAGGTAIGDAASVGGVLVGRSYFNSTGRAPAKAAKKAVKKTTG
jgi:hypothetical protein